MMKAASLFGAVERRLLQRAVNRGYLRGAQRHRTVRVDAIGEKLQEWIQSPLQVATFGPRVTLGALLAAPERIQQLPEDLGKVQEVLSAPGSADEKASILLEEAEMRLVDCLERGATVEKDVYLNVRALLPEDLQKNLPENLPFAPAAATESPTVEAEAVEEEVTYTSASVAAEKATSETKGLSDAIIAVRTAQSTLRTNTSEAREKMLKMNLQEERAFLKTMLSEIDVTGPGMEALMTEAKALLAETEESTDST